MNIEFTYPNVQKRYDIQTGLEINVRKNDMKAIEAKELAENRRIRNAEILPLLSSIYNKIRYEASENGYTSIQWVIPDFPELTDEQMKSVLSQINANGYTCTLNRNEHDGYSYLNISWGNNESK